mmetsp:Transcript_113523/g.232261  ORF Transcript_113523/g.232261 Transcript_113523/m.232261 type:complete len:214 (+) Transcript_113523:775-1416(+)
MHRRFGDAVDRVQFAIDFHQEVGLRRTYLAGGQFGIAGGKLLGDIGRREPDTGQLGGIDFHRDLFFRLAEHLDIFRAGNTSQAVFQLFGQTQEDRITGFAVLGPLQGHDRSVRLGGDQLDVGLTDPFGKANLGVVELIANARPDLPHFVHIVAQLDHHRRSAGAAGRADLLDLFDLLQFFFQTIADQHLDTVATSPGKQRRYDGEARRERRIL